MGLIQKITKTFQKQDTPRTIKNMFGILSSTRTPDLIDQLYSNYNPNAFMTRKDFYTIDKMLTDEQVFGILEMKKYTILSTGFHFVLPDNAENPKFQEHLDFIEKNFKANYQGLFNTDLYNMLTNQEYGFSFTEKIFERKGDKINMTRLKTVPPHSVEFTSNTQGDLSSITQRQETGTMELIKHKDKFIIFTNGERFNNPYGRSDLERCYTSWFAKNEALKYYLIYAQRFASPFPVAQVDEQFGEAKVNEMSDILDSIQQTVSMVIGKDVDLELHKVADSSGEYDRLLERLNQMIGRALLVPDLAGFGQSTKGGSFALGSEQIKGFLRILDYTRVQLETIINKEIIQPLIDMNFGKQEFYPEFRFLPFEDDNLKDILDQFIQSVEKGMPVSGEDWNHFRKLIDFPEADESAEPVKKDDKDDAEITEPQDNDKLIENALKFKKKKEFKATRTPSKYESRIDFIKEANELQQAEDITVIRLADIFDDIKENLKDFVVRRKIVEKGNLEAVDKLKLGAGKKFMGQARVALQRDMKKVYKKAFDEAKAEIKRFEKEQNFAKPNATRVDSSELKDSASEVIDSRAFNAIGNLNDEILGRAQTTLINGIEQGASTNEIVNNLDTVFNPVVFGAATAELSATPALLETIVRTNFTNIANMARKQVARSTDIGEFVWGFEYSAILDSRTTEICNRLDGTRAKKDDPIWDRITPSNHFNCRSILRYITQFDVEEDDVKPSKKPNLDSLRKLPGAKSNSGDFF